MTSSVDNPSPVQPSPSHAAPPGDTEGRSRRTMYLVIGVVVLALVVVGLVTFRSAKSSAAADQKADQLISALNAAGLRAPTKEQIVRVLGDDGGAVCANPSSALTRAVLLGELTNGAGSVGLRPVIVDNTVVQGQLLIIKVYCPEQLQKFTDFVNGLKYAPVAKG
jgi:Tfp pilus assembly protein FimT